MGVRPENFVVVDDGGLFDTDVHFVEPQGSHTVFVIDLDGQQLKLVSSDHFDLKVGESIGIDINQKSLFFLIQTVASGFDKTLPKGGNHEYCNDAFSCW